MPFEIHPSHQTRMSDSSLYDEKCVKCGATDGRNDDRLEKPCPGEFSAPRARPERAK